MTIEIFINLESAYKSHLWRVHIVSITTKGNDIIFSMEILRCFHFILYFSPESNHLLLNGNMGIIFEQLK